MASKTQIVDQLYPIFGGNDLTKTVIGNVVDTHAGNFDKVVEALLKMNQSVDAPSPVPVPAKAPSHDNNLDTVQSMFGADLTRSVIATVYKQNQGDLVQTVDTLLNISNDEEAIEAIKKMNAEEKKAMEEQMKRQQELRLNGRKEQLEREIAHERAEEKRLREEELRLREAEQKLREEEAKHAQLMQEEAERRRAQQKEQEHQKVMDEKAKIDQLHEDEKRKQEGRAKLQIEMKRMLEHQAQQIEEKQAQIARKEIFVSRITQQAALCTLSVVYGAKTIIVSWSLGRDMKGLPNDWIGFFKVSQPTKYRQYIKTEGKSQGSHHFPTPKTPGLYQFKYFANGTYDEVCVSDIVHIGPQLVMQASLSQNFDQVEVEYSLKGGELTADDWFGLYQTQTENNNRYLSFQKVGNNIPQAQSSAKIIFTAPRTPGNYCVRFFPKKCGYQHVSESNIIKVVSRDQLVAKPTIDEKTGRCLSVSVTWDIHSVDVTSYDYVALYKKDAPNNYYVAYKYVDTKAGFLVFDAPKDVATYEFRYHSAGSRYVDCARSAELPIANTDSVTVVVNGNLVAVTWDIHSQTKTSWDWVGLYKLGEQSNKNYVAYKFIDMASNALVFEKPKQSGEYEVRYFSYNVGRYTSFRKSEPFAVQARQLQ